MNSIIFLIMTVVILEFINAQQLSFNYENMLRRRRVNKKTSNRRNSNSRRSHFFAYETPGTLPPPPKPKFTETSENIYQGIRHPKADKRVLNKKLYYDQVMKRGHIYTCKVQFNCLITFISVETEQCIPILMNGGVGYNHMTVIVKAKAGKQISGRIQAYCKRDKKSRT